MPHAGARPAREHRVQLYTEEGFLARGVAQFVGDGLAHGGAALLLVTPAHSEAIRTHLAARLDVESARAEDRLVLLDARDSLAQLLRGGMPEPGRFADFFVPRVAGLRGRGFGDLRLFGEMVDLLVFDGAADAAEALETLWEAFVAAQRVSLLCAYRIDIFDRRVHRGLLQRICRSHSHVVPIEDCERLESAVARAYAEVFGARDDTALLRELLSSRVPAIPEAPAAHRALVALRDVGADIADEVLARARVYYAAGC